MNIRAMRYAIDFVAHGADRLWAPGSEAKDELAGPLATYILTTELSTNFQSGEKEVGIILGALCESSAISAISAVKSFECCLGGVTASARPASPQSCRARPAYAQ
jgi:hypothetical protein